MRGAGSRSARGGHGDRFTVDADRDRRCVGVDDELADAETAAIRAGMDAGGAGGSGSDLDEVELVGEPNGRGPGGTAGPGPGCPPIIGSSTVLGSVTSGCAANERRPGRAGDLDIVELEPERSTNWPHERQLKVHFASNAPGRSSAPPNKSPGLPRCGALHPNDQPVTLNSRLRDPESRHK